jgi:hypothetical protein
VQVLGMVQALVNYMFLTGFLEVFFLGVLFHVTGEFAAPMVAGVSLAAVEFFGMKRRMVEEC